MPCAMWMCGILSELLICSGGGGGGGRGGGGGGGGIAMGLPLQSLSYNSLVPRAVFFSRGSRKVKGLVSVACAPS